MISSGCDDCFFNGIEDRSAQVLGTTLARCDTGNDVCSILNHLLRVEATLLSSHSAHDNARVFVHEDSH